MENEQCGLCWDLRFDSQGHEIHDQKYLHGFIPIDYCAKCREPKYDSYGIQTHLEYKNDFLNLRGRIGHKFISGSKVNFQKQRRKKRKILVYFLLVCGTITSIINIPDIFF